MTTEEQNKWLEDIKKSKPIHEDNQKLEFIIKLLKQIEKNTRKKTRVSTTNQIKFESHDFETTYLLYYPKKVTKYEGLKECQKQIETPEDFQDWQKAMMNYSDFFKSPSTSENFVPAPRDFIRFMKNEYWRDWIDREPYKNEVTDYSFLKEE